MAARYVRIGQYPDYRDEIRGTLLEILASTANPGTYAAPEDVAGCTLEMGADGKWVGCLGVFASDTAMAAATGGNYVNLSISGVTAITATITMVWSGTAWVSVGVSVNQLNRYGYAMVGDSLSAASGNGGWYDFTAIISNGRFLSRGNFAVSGYSLYQMRPQMDAAIASGAAHIYIMGGTNRHAKSTGDPLNYVGGAIEDMTYLVTKCIAAGAECTIFGVPPAQAVSVPNYIQYCDQINRAYRVLATKYNVGYKYLWGHVIDPATGGILSGMNGQLNDGVHLSQTAQYQAAQKLLAGLTATESDIYLPSFNQQISGTELWSNPLHVTETTANVLAANWTASGLVAGFTTSTAPADSGFGRKQSLNAAAITTEKSIVRILTGVVIGHKYVIVAHIKVTASADTIVRMGIQWVDGGYALIRNDYALYGVPNGGIEGLLYMETTAPEGIDVTKSRFIIAASGSAAAPLTAVCDIDRHQCYDMGAVLQQ